MKTHLSLLFLMLASLATGACGRKVGDHCKTSFDCNDTDNSRTCDTSQPGGYCTVEGCDDRSCPEDSACIRFFPRLYLTRPCDPAAPPPGTCREDELCLDSGMCAPRSSERRYCAHTCGNGGDCRDDYECRLAGTLGSMALTRTPGKTVRFCAPKEPD